MKASLVLARLEPPSCSGTASPKTSLKNLPLGRAVAEVGEDEGEAITNEADAGGGGGVAAGNVAGAPAAAGGGGAAVGDVPKRR